MCVPLLGFEFFNVRVGRYDSLAPTCVLSLLAGYSYCDLNYV